MTLGSLSLAVLLLLGSAPRPDTPAAPAPPTVEQAVQNGCHLLLEGQESLGDDGEKREWPYEGVYRFEGQIPIGYRVGGTAICAWALVESSGWRESKERQKAVWRGLDFILASLKDPAMGPTFRGRYDVRGWGQIYALDLLTRLTKVENLPERYRRPVADAIPLLVRALEKTEIPHSGGWNYSRPAGFRGESDPCTFMTASALQALFAAAAAGQKVDGKVVRRALDTLESARLKSGAFQYSTAPKRRAGVGFQAVPGACGRMPICETTLLLAGRSDPGRVRGAVDAFFENWKWLEQRRKKTGTHLPPYMIAPYYFFFAHYYAAQAIELLPAADRPPLRQHLRELLWKVREEDGGWNDRVFPRSENFGTAMAILALLSPKLAHPATWPPATQKEQPEKKPKTGSGRKAAL